ncbi:hypothetical protein IWQ62_004719 [Dispira parvispora]|uniref:RGS domain-containing protein n=1 Tax=Dispira parvispora TaxID=1520584 RepID=A0A9W8E5W5_9FUNG|nr:hypothetical protein IWQ62_004719 [Dispira parvispora]
MKEHTVSTVTSVDFDSSTPRSIVYWVIIAAYFILFTVTTTVFYIRSKYVRDIRLRSPGLTILMCVLGFLLAECILLASVYPKFFPVSMVFWGMHIGGCLWVAIMIYRATRFIMVARQNEDKIHWVATIASGARICTCDKLPGQRPPLLPILKKLLKASPTRKERTGTVTLSQYVNAEKLEAPTSSPDGVFICSHRCRAVYRAMRIVIFIVLCLWISYCATIHTVTTCFNRDPFSPSCIYINDYYLPLMIFFGMHIFLICPAMVYLLWGIHDGYHIRNEMIHTIIITGTCLCMYIFLRAVTTELSRYIHSADIFALAMICTHITLVVVPIIKTWSQRRHHQGGLESSVELKQSANYIDFQRVVSDKLLFHKLKETAAECFCTESILFLEDYQRLKGKVYYSYLKSQNSTMDTLFLPDFEEVSDDQDHDGYGSEINLPAFNDSGSILGHDCKPPMDKLPTELPKSPTPRRVKTQPSFIEFPTPITYTIYDTIDEYRNNIPSTAPTQYGQVAGNHLQGWTGRIEISDYVTQVRGSPSNPLCMNIPGYLSAVPAVFQQQQQHHQQQQQQIYTTLTSEYVSANVLRSPELSTSFSGGLSVRQRRPSYDVRERKSSISPNPAVSTEYPQPLMTHRKPSLPFYRSTGVNEGVVLELKHVYNKYFSSHSEFILPVEQPTLHQIKYKAERGLWKLDMFDSARDELLHLVYANVFPKFLDLFSEIF